MVSAGDFKNGITIEIEGNIYQIMEFQHVKPGKGAALVRTKLKNIISEELLRRHSVLQRNLRMLISREKICSICIRMEISITSWIWRHMIRSH